MQLLPKSADANAASLTIFAGTMTARLGHRASLLAASALMMLTGIGFAACQRFWPLLIVAFVGTLNPSSGDVSIFLPLEQSLLSQSVVDQELGATPRSLLGPSRTTVYRLAMLFSIDAFGGGLFIQTILALWLFKTFELSIVTTMFQHVRPPEERLTSRASHS